MSTSNAVALVPQQTAQVVSLDEWSQARIDFVVQNYCGGAPPEVASAFIALARKRRLAPEEKQIYLIKRGEKWGPETSIDGYRLIADRTEAYAGSDVPEFGPPIDGHPEWAKVTVYKIVQGQRVSFAAIAYWDEFAPEGKQAFMWARMPRQMLAKCAEAQALRKAFPADLSGIYVAEEMHQADDLPRTATVRDVTPKGAKPRAVPAGDDRAKAATAVGNAITRVFRVSKGGASHIARDLICYRFDLEDPTSATTEQLNEIRETVDRWQTADVAKSALAWLTTISTIETESELVDVGADMESKRITDPFLHAAIGDRLARFEEDAAREQFAEIDAAVEAAVVP